MPAPAAPAPEAAPERQIGFYEALSCPEWARIRERQQAIKYPPSPPPPEVYGPPAPQPKGYDPIVNGLWRGEPKLVLVAPKAVPPPVPAPHAEPWRDWEFDEAGPTGRRRGRFP
jgi:hypothetical protein